LSSDPRTSSQPDEIVERPTNEYLTFVEFVPEGRKTAVVNVEAARDGSLLGQVRWFGRWRQYAFFPADGCVFNEGCLTTINAYMAALMEERRG
jgi:hypothetical protein